MSNCELSDHAKGGTLFSRTVFRIALTSASALVLSVALAAPALADDAPVAPGQYFYGEFFGLTGAAANVITVNCAGPADVGHPANGQYVAAHELFPPVAVTAGYTGSSGSEVDVNLTWARGGVGVVTPPFAEILFYDTKVEIPTTITVPCSGTGVMGFSPTPNADGTGRSSDLSVTFVSPGVSPGA
jgi:hypothetical protein